MIVKKTTARLAIVLSHPTQYYSPWFTHLAAEGTLEFRVFYLWDFGVREATDPLFERSFKWDIDLLQGYAHEWVPNESSHPGTQRFSGLHNPTLRAVLRNYAPSHVLLFGYKYRSHLRLIAAARREGWKLIFRGDSHILGRNSLNGFKRLLLRKLYQRFDRILYVGKANRAYFEYLGVPAPQLIFAPHAVDATRFSQAIAPEKILAARAAIGVDPQTQLILFAGKFHAEKAPRTLLEAFARCGAQHAKLVFAGDGPERESLMAEVRNRKLENVLFLPFANQSEMPLRYAMADLMVLPSEGWFETWGLAVNEAMHAGVPCLVSDRVGCHLDLITEDLTGWCFPAGDRQALTQKIDHALSALAQPETRAQLRQNVRARIAHYTYRQTSQGLWEALTETASASP